MKDAVRPADHAISLSVAHVFNPSGDVAFAAATDRFLGEQVSRSRPGPVHPTAARFPAVFKKAPNTSDQFCQATSTLVVFTNQAAEVGQCRPLPSFLSSDALEFSFYSTVYALGNYHIYSCIG